MGPERSQSRLETGSVTSWPANYGGSNAIVTNAVAHSGTYSLSMSGPSNTGIGQTIGNLIPGQQYLVSAWVNVGAGATADLYANDAADTTSGVQVLQTQTTGWQYLSVPYTVNSTGEIGIRLWFFGSGTVYWDDVTVTPAVGANDPGFESGALASWPANWGSNATVSSAVAHSGTYSLSMSGPSGDGGLATKAQLYWPTSLVLDSAGNIYIADSENQRIRRIDCQRRTSSPRSPETEAHPTFQEPSN